MCIKLKILKKKTFALQINVLRRFAICLTFFLRNNEINVRYLKIASEELKGERQKVIITAVGN